MGRYIDAGAIFAALTSRFRQLFYLRSPRAFRFNRLGQIRGVGTMSLLPGFAGTASICRNHTPGQFSIARYHVSINDSRSYSTNCEKCAASKEVMIMRSQGGACPRPGQRATML